MSRTVITNLSISMLLVAAGAGHTASGGAGTTEPAPAASVSLVSPADGDHVAGAVPLTMTADGIDIERAGEVHDGAGHFHVIADRGCLAQGVSIVKDVDHVHFGDGQLDGVIYLEPGLHELCLQVGDGVHVARELTDTATVDVGVDSADEWCAVIGEVDELFSTVDGSDDEFPVKQLGYEAIRRLVAQLRAGTEHVDEAARPDVAAALAWVVDLLSALAWSRDETEAEALVGPLFERYPEGVLPGSAWILERCDVDVNG